MRRILNVDGERIRIETQHAMTLLSNVGSYTYKSLTCGHELHVGGDPYYEATDGRTWCLSCVRRLEER